MKNIISKDKLIELFNKDKKTLIVVCVGLIGVLLIMISEIDFKEKNIEEKSLENQKDSYEYCTYLEERVADIVGSIEGAGSVRVMITLAETTEYVYAQNQNDTKKSNNSSENSDNQSDFVIIEKDNNDSGLLIKTFEPKIRGVAIVCDGGDDPIVQQQIYSTVSSILNVSTARISISKLAQEKGNHK